MQQRRQVMLAQLEARIKTSAERELLARNLIRKELVEKASQGDTDGVKQLLEMVMFLTNYICIHTRYAWLIVCMYYCMERLLRSVRVVRMERLVRELRLKCETILDSRFYRSQRRTMTWSWHRSGFKSLFNQPTNMYNTFLVGSFFWATGKHLSTRTS